MNCSDHYGEDWGDVTTEPELPCLTVGGAVMFENGFMHPEQFRQTFGEEMYQEMIKRPRVVCGYDA